MLLWLPLFTGSALAASVSMLLPQNSCHDTAAANEPIDMGAMDMSAMDMGTEHQMHHGNMSAPADDHSNCGVCQLACTGYLAGPAAGMVSLQLAHQFVTPFFVSYTSVTTVPLLPPPLARA